ncbi:MAG: rhodanese-related sulfurtransferase [Verrucomicrobiota bacterium]|nr:rhodanese-related sulfurtransferase [Verrucomicrobiota bacterium]
MTYKVLAYYSIEPLETPLEEVAQHKEFFKTRDFKGRIYLSEQGINGQASGRADHADEYMEWMRGRFPKMFFKVHLAEEHAYPKMTVKYRKQLVAVDCPVDFSLAGEHISPQEWKKMLENRDEETLLLDVRNDYEWKVGHFEGAELPQLETFRQFPEYAKKLKEQKDPKTTRVFMYCTGGIRCEYFSALMKQEGFENVYQLDGGVINYNLQEGGDRWEGKLFVFDDRLVVPMGDGEPISSCSHCSQPHDVYFNCANMDCNQLFICCSDCLRKHRGCCCSDCESPPRVRPYQEGGKPFRKWDYLEKCSFTKLKEKGAP